jgi:hypothetical protein
MSRSLVEELPPKETDETTDAKELYLRDGRKITVSDVDRTVEIRSESGMLELRIVLTDQGPVLQMETVRMQIKATESLEIESKRVEIKATEQLAVTSKDVEIKAEENVEVEAGNDVRVNGKMIYLNS